MSSRVSYDTSSASLLHSTTNDAVHSTTIDTLTFANYSPHQIQACLDSTIMTYLQQQQRHQSPTTYPLQKQNRSQQLRPVPPIDTQKHKTIEKRLVDSDLTSTQRSVHLGTGARIAPGHSARDQTKLSTELQRCNKDLQRHERHRPAEIMRPLHRGGQSPRDVVVDNHEDDSEYGEETVKDDGDQDEDSEMDDSDYDDDYDNESDIDNDHTETEQSIHGSISLRQNDPLRIGLAPCQRVSQGPSLDASDGLDNTQKVQQELVEQMEIAAKTWANGDIHGSTPQHSPSTNSANSINYSNNHNTLYGPLSDEEAHLRLERTMSPGDTSNHGYRNGTMGNTAYNTATVNQSSRANASGQYPQHQNGGLLLCSSSNGSSPIMDSREARMRTVPYVDDEDEENDEEDGEDEDDDEDGEDDEDDEEDDEDEMSDEYDEEEEEEEEYSYSEEEDEDEEDGSMTEYHYGSKDDVRVRGHYPRSGYPHYRLPRLDGNFLQKRAINKQVERRSSLTALLGEASQPEMQPRNIALQAVGVPFGQHIRQHNVVTRRPALSCVWTENDGAVQDTNRPPRVESRMDNNSSNRTSNTASAGVPPAQPHVSVIPSIDALIQTQESQEPNRPRRTDSGVVVKLSPQLHRMPAISHSNIDGNQSTTEETVSSCDAPAASTSSSPSATPVLTHRSMIKSEGDVLGEGAINHTPRGADAPRRPETVGAACGSKTLNNLKQPLRSSISCNTFPRVTGKRDGRKHVSWHHSLFPTERVLRVKPSLPSLSTVAAESAKATLSQLPSIPVMAKDNVKDFHQSIKSLRTVSRIEITKMSYKQQGRQELTSPVPIARSVHDSIPWWNPSRWLKGSVTVDKRHWKPDSSRESCAFCYAPFHRITNPRHHCRKCGDIFCGKCASAEILMDARNCVYVQQSQLARWSRRVDIQRHNLWIDTLPQLHPVRTAVESALVDGHSAAGHAGGMNGGVSAIGGVSMIHRSASGIGSGSGRRGSWQIGPAALKKSRLSIFGLFGNGAPGPAVGNAPYNADSRRGSMDVAGAESVLVNHYSHLQPHSQNPMSIGFSAGRRSSSSSILWSNTVNGSSHSMISGGLHGQSEGGLVSMFMSRRMSSGGVGEICLARICVGCERELLKPVPRCTSIARYYGSLNSRNAYRRYGHGYSSLGPHPGRHHPGLYGGPLAPHPMNDADPTVTVNNEYLHNGVHRHSPLVQASYIADTTTHPENELSSQSRPPEDGQGYYEGGEGHGSGTGWDPREEAIGPHGESRRHSDVLTFQDQQVQYTQQTHRPMHRELS